MTEHDSGTYPLTPSPTNPLTPKLLTQHGTESLDIDNGGLAVRQDATDDGASSCPSLTDDQSNSNGNFTPRSPRHSRSLLSIRSSLDASTQPDSFPTLPSQDTTSLKNQPTIQESDCELVVSVAGRSWELPTLTTDTMGTESPVSQTQLEPNR
jgi:hypothetical protein